MIRTLFIAAAFTTVLAAAAFAGDFDHASAMAATGHNCDQQPLRITSSHPSSGGGGVDSDPDVDVLAMHAPTGAPPALR